MEATGCRFKCCGRPSTYQCTSGWSAPDARIEMSMLCLASPYSTCNDGQCLQTAPAHVAVEQLRVCLRRHVHSSRQPHDIEWDCRERRSMRVDSAPHERLLHHTLLLLRMAVGHVE